MAAPTYITAPAGSTDAGGAWFSTSFAGTVGNVVIFQILQDGATADAVAVTGFNSVNALDGTTDSLTFIGSFQVGGTLAARQHLWIGRRTSASVCQINGTNSTSEDLYIRAYEFANVSTGTTLDTVIENSAAGGVGANFGTSATASDALVRALGPDRLALHFVAVNDDNAIAVFTGQTGGTWVEAVAGYAESSGTDGAIQLQTSTMAVIAQESGTTVNAIGQVYPYTAQSFTPASSFTAKSVSILLTANVGTPTDGLIIDLRPDSGGTALSTTVLASAAITPPTSGWAIAVLDTEVALSSGTKYWLVVSRTGSLDLSNYRRWLSASSDVLAGEVKGNYQSDLELSGSTGTNDLAFQIFSAVIDGGTASITDSDAWGVVGFALIGTTTITPAPSRIPYRNRMPVFIAQ